MLTIELVSKSKNQFVIKHVGILNERKKLKLNIFLDGFSDLKLIKYHNEYELNITTSDDYYIGESISKICEYLKKITDNLDVDKYTIDVIDKYLNENISNENLKQKMIEIKANIDTDGFNEFKNFCDLNLSIKLRDYQYESAFLLSMGKGGFDFSVPGAGKTIISYAVYKYLSENNVIDKIMVIGPMNAYNAWYEEYITCFGHEPDFINLSRESVSNCKDYLMSSNNYHNCISFINYDKLRYLAREIRSFIEGEKILLIVDEVHRAKNPSAAVTEAILSFASFSKARILLTGTPMPNGYEDLYSLTKIFDLHNDILPYSYNKLKDFSKNGAKENEIDSVKKSLFPYFSRVSKKRLIERGELIEANFHPIVNVEMNKSQIQLYKMLNNFYGKIRDEIDEDLLESLKKAALIRKMQISANPGLLKRSLEKVLADTYDGKCQSEKNINDIIEADELLMNGFLSSNILSLVNDYYNYKEIPSKNNASVDLIKSLLEREKSVLVWDVFVDNIYALKHLFAQNDIHDVEVINGNVSLENRQIAIKNFRNKRTRVLIANPATLAESISLHKICQQAIYVNRNFNCAQFIQSKDRIHRINMPNGTTANYYFINNLDTVDEIVNERLRVKEQRMLQILDNDGLIIGNLEDNGEGITLEDLDAVFNAEKIM